MKDDFLEKIKNCYYEKTGYMPSKFLMGYLKDWNKILTANKKVVQQLVEEFRPYAKDKCITLDGPDELTHIKVLEWELVYKIKNDPELEHRLRNNKYIKKYQKSIEFVNFSSWNVDLSKETRNILTCYYVSGVDTSEEIIKNLALNQINSSCKEAIFYCPHPNELQSKWHTLFDDVFVDYHLENNIEITENNVLMTSDFHESLCAFIREIESTARALDDQEDVIYVFYDSKDTLGEHIINAIYTMEVDAFSLDTPLCSFELEDSEHEKLQFDIIPTYNPCRSVYEDDDSEKAILTKYCKTSTIVIDAYDLEIGKTYYLKCSKPLEWVGSGERKVEYGRTEEDKTLAIGMPNLNEAEKDDVDGLEVDKSVLKFYEIEQVDANTFSIELLDRDVDIELNVAWVWNIKDHMSDFEAAVDCLV
ncbi:MAG: hypothetical protein J6B34_00950 [Clostridia bacterium]|nr:hypothetical protein [Clostridia bacterium]